MGKNYVGVGKYLFVTKRAVDKNQH